MTTHYANLEDLQLISLQSEDNMHNKEINIEWRSRYGMNFPYKLDLSGNIKNCVMDALVGDRECDLLILQQANRLRDERVTNL